MTDVVLDGELAPLDAPVPDDVRELANTFFDLVRTANRIRTRWLAAAAHDVEWSAHVLLKAVAGNGPLRAGALAECVHSDPSTVSRQVAALVKEGLLERRADPEDGRASLLVVTDRGANVLGEHDEIRLRHFAGMLEDWSERDVHRFVMLLRRFADDLGRSGEVMLPTVPTGSSQSTGPEAIGPETIGPETIGPKNTGSHSTGTEGNND
jgi:DNA-binding MarR family transcriptional regulator